MNFPEELLHFVWQYRYFDHNGLFTDDLQTLEVVYPGIYNRHSGPDFENARLRIGGTVWVGSVEIHLRSSDWERHAHQFDKAYGNVILHVVFINDKIISRADNTILPVLSLQNRIPQHIFSNFSSLMYTMDSIPCRNSLSLVPGVYINSWLSRTLAERLEVRAASIDILIEELRGNWDEAFYISLARNFGFRVNAIPFEQLARSTPQKLLGRHRDQQLQVECLLFGNAGFLNKKLRDEYPARLYNEYTFLSKKYFLRPADKFTWKFMRMHPQNFPTLRLAQFAALLSVSGNLFSRIIEAREIAELKAVFTDLPVNPYWKTHYRFDTPGSGISTRIGEQSVHNLLINTVASFLFSFGRKFGEDALVGRSFALLESLPPENNSITREFQKAGIKSVNSFESQALIQLKSNYCSRKKCVSCGIGNKILSRHVPGSDHLF